ncbi:MAG: M24 family metallopeptidase [bacterium]
MERMKKLQNALIDHKIDCALILYHRDIYYYAGTARPAALAVAADTAVLFTRRAVNWTVTESVVPDIREGGLGSVLDMVKEKGLHKGKVGIEMDLVPTNIYLRLQELLPESSFTDISPIILEQRLIKDEKEIRAIKGACRMVEEPHRRLPHILQEGMTELELAAELEKIVRVQGHEGFAIPRKRMETEMGYALLLSGESTKIIGGYGQVVTGTGLSPAFPYGPSRKEIRAGDMVVFDIAGLNHGYHSDLARTYCVGRVPPSAHDAHSALLAIQSAMLRVAKPGVSARQVYETATSKAEEMGWADHFQGYRNQRGTFVGHGLGLEIDEAPLLSPKDETVLKENMVFTTELFMVHPEFGEVKLEDTLLMTKDGPQFLTETKRRIFPT